MLRMATFTLEKVLSDARSLVSRLKEQENTADSLVTQTQELSKKVDSMKMYQENLSALTEMARQRPHAQLTIGIFQENSEISELDQENIELRQAVDEHQSAIELIMSRYRDQIQHLVAANRTDRALYSTSPDHSQDVQEKVDQIYKMADVMWSALKTDNSRVAIEAQRLAQLRVENETLRDLLTAGRHSLASAVTSRHIQTDCPPVAPLESTPILAQCVTADNHAERSRCESEQSDDSSLNNTTVFETSTLKRAGGRSPGIGCNEVYPQRSNDVVDVDLSDVSSTSDGAKPQIAADSNTSSDVSHEHETTTDNKPSNDDVASASADSHESCESDDHVAAVDLCDITVSCSAVDAVSLSVAAGNTDDVNITQSLPDERQLLTAGNTDDVNITQSDESQLLTAGNTDDVNITQSLPDESQLLTAGNTDDVNITQSLPDESQLLTAGNTDDVNITQSLPDESQLLTIGNVDTQQSQ